MDPQESQRRRRGGWEAAPGVLIVAPLDEDLIELLRILSEADWNLFWYTTRTDAAANLKSKAVSVVICDRVLRDGDWKDIAEQLASLAKPPSPIVTAGTADERLRSDVLDRGGYGALAKPFHGEEVMRTVVSAWRACEHGEVQRPGAGRSS